MENLLLLRKYGFKEKSANIDNIINAIRLNKIKITDHADEEAQADCITFNEVYFSVIHGEIVEEYIKDKPYPSCLIYGKTFNGDPVHSV
ncbi:MAG: DUF4258 domain-containing protein [Armatimonadota bacterium]